MPWRLAQVPAALILAAGGNMPAIHTWHARSLTETRRYVQAKTQGIAQPCDLPLCGRRTASGGDNSVRSMSWNLASGELATSAQKRIWAPRTSRGWSGRSARLCEWRVRRRLPSVVAVGKEVVAIGLGAGIRKIVQLRSETEIAIATQRGLVMLMTPIEKCAEHG